MKAAIYARVSTEDKGQDPENQLRLLKVQAGEDALVFIDRLTASGKCYRTEFERMKTAAMKGQFDTLFVWSIDRLTREGVMATFQLIDELYKYGVKVKSYQESWLDPSSPVYELVLSMTAWVAQQEIKRISERTKAGIARYKAQGGRVGGRPPIDPEVIKEVIHLGVEQKGVWTQKEISEKTGLSRASVSRILSGSMYPKFPGKPSRPPESPRETPPTLCDENE